MCEGMEWFEQAHHGAFFDIVRNTAGPECYIWALKQLVGHFDPTATYFGIKDKQLENT